MSSIIDNVRDNTLLRNLQLTSNGGCVLLIATAFFSLDALMMLADCLSPSPLAGRAGVGSDLAAGFDRIRILFGSDAGPEQRRRLLALMRERSDLEGSPA